MKRNPAGTTRASTDRITVRSGKGQQLDVDLGDAIASSPGSSSSYVAGETLIGTFLGQPLYRKVITFTTGPATAGDNRVVAHGIGAYVLAVRLYGYLYRASNGTRIPVPYPHTDAQFNILAFADDTNIELRTSGGDYTTFTGHMVIEYTKT